jgi:uncharacterized protein (DUF983 family)
MSPMFKSLFSMYPQCQVCHLRFEREQGYFLGAIYINYAVTVIMVLTGFFILEYMTDVALLHQILLWCAFGVVFPLFFYRYSKSLWLSIDCIFDPPGQE